MKWRLLAAFIGLVTMVLVAQDVPLLSYLRDVEKDRLLASLERDAFVLAGGAENLLANEGNVPTQADVQAAIQQYSAQSGARVVVTDRFGSAVAFSGTLDQAGDDYSNRPEFAEALSGQPSKGERLSTTAGTTLVYVAVPVLSGAETFGAVRITYPASVIEDRARRKATGLIVVFGISLVAAVLAALLMAHTVVAPIRRLQRSTERLAMGDFRARVATDEGPPEIRSLARSFNAMTEQISTLVERQKAFAGDASHQLRTPLTALRLQLERGAQLLESDPGAAREQIEAAGAETERLQRLVQGLLLIARSDESTISLSSVDISQLLHERNDLWAPLAEERGIVVGFDIPDGLVALSDQSALEQIVDNYIDNALAVCASGDAVIVIAHRDQQRITITVSDDGPGMRPEHLERAFDRFWRSPDAAHDGSGIGLAIVQHLATLIGAEVKMWNRSGRPGLCASVSVSVQHSQDR